MKNPDEPKRFIYLYKTIALIVSIPNSNIEFFHEAWDMRSPSFSLMTYKTAETNPKPFDPFLWMQESPLGRTLSPDQALHYGEAIYLAGKLAEELNCWLQDNPDATDSDLFDWAIAAIKRWEGIEITMTDLHQIRTSRTQEGLNAIATALGSTYHMSSTELCHEIGAFMEGAP